MNEPLPPRIGWRGLVDSCAPVLVALRAALEPLPGDDPDGERSRCLDAIEVLLQASGSEVQR